jgi:hypothetical protein
MESIRRSRPGMKRAVLAVSVGALTLGSLALLPRADASGEVPSWPYARIAESARYRAGLSAVRPGDVAIIEFSLGAFRGSDIFVPGAPASVEIGCASRTAFRHGEALDPAAHGTLDYDVERDVYTYLWVTSATWSGTCRRLNLDFADGSSHDVLIWFGEPFGIVAQAPIRT